MSDVKEQQGRFSGPPARRPRAPARRDRARPGTPHDATRLARYLYDEGIDWGVVGVGALMAPPRYLSAGDHVRVEIDGIDAIENVVVDDAWTQPLEEKRCARSPSQS